jgi:small subunit ribosomal protein S1
MSSQSTSSGQQNPSFSRDDFAKALEGFDFQFNKGTIISGKVIQYGTDGVFVDIQGKSPGFIPLKEVPANTVTDLAVILPLETQRDFLIIQGQDEDGQVTLSLRQLALKETWKRLGEFKETGAGVQMLVTGVNKGGVTGELDGLRAFIPRSHLLQRDHLESLIGQVINANLLEVDSDHNKLILSQRQMAQSAAIDELEEGSLVEGTISRIEAYGVFVGLDNITGLLHIKQISSQRIESIFNLFRVGETIKAVIVELDTIKKRISLSTKILEDYPGEILEKKAELFADAENRLEKARQKLEAVSER